MKISRNKAFSLYKKYSEEFKVTNQIRKVGKENLTECWHNKAYAYSYPYIAFVNEENILCIIFYKFAKDTRVSKRVSGCITKMAFINKDSIAITNGCSVEQNLNLYVSKGVVPVKEEYEKLVFDQVKALGWNNEADSIYNLLANLSSEYSIRKKRERYAPEIKEIDTDVESLKKVPVGFIRWCKGDALKDNQFAYYDAKEHTGYCTHCKSTFPMKKGKQNSLTKCPSCKTEITVKSIKIRNKDAFTPVNATLMQLNKKGELAIRYFNIYRNFDKDYKNPDINVTEEAFTIIGNDNNAREYEMNYFHCGMTRNGEYRWCKLTNGGVVLQEKPNLYKGNLNALINSTNLKYIGFKEFMTVIKKNQLELRWNSKPNGYIYEAYIRKALNHPFMEQLVKVGFYKLLSQAMSDSRFLSSINHKEGSIVKKLGITKQIYNILLKEGDPSVEQYETAKILSNKGITNEKDIKLFLEHEVLRSNTKSACEVVEKYTTTYKLAKYLNEQKAKAETDWAKRSVTTDYYDYIEFCEKLNYDLSNKFILFPPNLKEAHDREAANVKYQANKVEAEIINRLYLEDMHKEFDYKFKGIVIKAPDDAMEIIDEGHALHHCVGGYLEKVAKGQTTILFIRDEKDIKTPLATMEVKDGKIIQVRAHHNTCPEDNVCEAVMSFKKAKDLDGWIWEKETSDNNVAA